MQSDYFEGEWQHKQGKVKLPSLHVRSTVVTKSFMELMSAWFEIVSKRSASCRLLHDSAVASCLALFSSSFLLESRSSALSFSYPRSLDVCRNELGDNNFLPTNLPKSPDQSYPRTVVALSPLNKSEVINFNGKQKTMKYANLQLF
jgi:hypothetical protein